MNRKTAKMVGFDDQAVVDLLNAEIGRMANPQVRVTQISTRHTLHTGAEGIRFRLMTPAAVLLTATVTWAIMTESRRPGWEMAPITYIDGPRVIPPRIIDLPMQGVAKLAIEVDRVSLRLHGQDLAISFLAPEHRQYRTPSWFQPTIDVTAWKQRGRANARAILRRTESTDAAL